MGYTFYDVAAEDALVSMSRMKVDVGGFPVCLMQLEPGDYLACEDSCPHAGVSLSDGGVLGGEEKSLTCGSHLWCFELKSGICREFPHIVLRRFPVAVDAGRLFVGFWIDEGDGPDPLNPVRD